MNEYRSLLAAWPQWAKLAYVAGFLALLALSVVYGFGLAVWLLIGPLALAQWWMNRDSAQLGRSSRPWLFWIGLVVFSAMTLKGGVDLYLRLAEVTV